jgi:hypothetical protein
MTADHSFWLEYGTRKMKKRPFAKITFEKLSPEIKAELTKYGWLNEWTH